MRKLLNRTNIPFGDSRKNCRRGFSLVELVVVLAIIAILAAVAVVGLTGYVKRSKYTENSQNAILVYQTAQSALSQKSLNGTMNDWAYSLGSISHEGDWFTDADITAICADDATNRSVHKIVAYTYNPKTSDAAGDKFVHDLLVSGFYDQSIFSGTITLVFDVSATSDGRSDPIYSAIIHSVFYSKQNSYNSSWGGPWDPEYINGNGEESPWNKLPDRDAAFRVRTSFVGYFDGSEASITGPVALPADQVEENFIFTLRNGETLDITWAFFDDATHNKNFQIRLIDQDDPDNYVVMTIDETALIYDPSNSSTLNSPLPLDFLSSADPLPNNSCLSPAASEYEEVRCLSESVSTQIPYTINKESVEGLASVTIGEGAGATKLIIPITISRVSGDKRNIIPEENYNGYTAYTLSIDCMMNRQDYVKNPEGSAGHNMLYGIDRMFGNMPRNISAYISGTGITETYATRAIDDPMYMTGVVKTDEFTRYTYNTLISRGAYDSSDKCVVNTLFGDVYYEGNGVVVNGTSIDSTGGTAVITSYRHLSNIRMITDPNIHVDYKIARDLDWYTPSAFVDVADGITVTPDPVSQVKVFYSYADTTARNDAGYTGVRYHSPVENKQLKVVSFPAIHELYQNKTLSSLSSSAGDDPEIYSINGVQMRVASFNQSNKGVKDTSYGLICENLGTIYNIYTNNLNLIAVNMADGSDSDYIGTGSSNKVRPVNNSTITISNASSTRPLISGPVGGLVGKNSANGSLGLSNASVADGSNTIMMSNCIVMSSNYWVIYDDSTNNKQPVGGIVGDDLGYTNGMLAVNGSYAIVSRDQVGGAIGSAKKSVNALISVGGEPCGVCDYRLPAESRINGNDLSCVIASKNIAGGAIAQINTNNVSFTNPEADYSNDKYHIDVTLPENSLIVTIVGYKNESTGGAIGYLMNCTGDSLFIRVDNSGVVCNQNTGNNDWISVGGVIGYESNSSIANMYLNVHNRSGSVIGYVADQSRLPTYAGGVYGYLNSNSSISANRSFTAIVENEGFIGAKGSGSGGSGGFAGRMDGGKTLQVDLSVSNHSSATVTSGQRTGGVIGDNSCILNGTLSVMNYDNVQIIGTSGSYVGGVIGNNRSTVNASIDLNMYNTVDISGTDYIGGVIGYNAGSLTGAISATGTNNVKIYGNKNIGGLIGENSAQLSGALSSIFENNSYVSGSEKIGGVIGYNHAKVTTSVVFSATGNSYISGSTKVGGIFGHTSSDVSATLSSTISSDSYITGNGGNDVGGAIGHNESKLSSAITVNIADGCFVAGGNNVGGFAGNNSAEITGMITESLGSDTYISGAEKIGGVIGYNHAKISNAVSLVISDNSYVSGTTMVGGILGHTSSNISGALTASISDGSYVAGSGDHVAGGIGRNESAVSSAITITLSGSSYVEGVDNIGGAVGYSSGVISGSITSELSGGSKVSGNEFVGGAVGKTISNISGAVTSAVSADNAVTGGRYVGGAIGIVGSVGAGNTPTVSSVVVNVDTAFPVVQDASVSISNTEDACIGGAIGCVNLGTVNSVELNGSGAEVTVSDPSMTCSNAIWINGYGRSIGGLIGKIGYSGVNTASVRVSDMTLDDVSVCVTSNNNADMIGGWVGSCYGKLGGDNSASAPDFNVSNVKVVSGGSDVGAFCGYLYTGSRYIYANIDLDLSDSIISGNDNVGGAVGYMSSVNYMTFSDVTINDTSILGNDNVGGMFGSINSCTFDSSGSVLPAMTIDGLNIYANTNVGGVIGYISGGTFTGGITVDSLTSSSVIGSGDYVSGMIGQFSSGTFNGGITISALDGLDVEGTDYVSGAIGLWNGGTFNGGITVDSLTSSSIIGSGDYVSGMIGKFSSGTFNGGITISALDGLDVEGTDYVSGAIGVIGGGKFNGGITYSACSDLYVKGNYTVGGAIADLRSGEFYGGIIICLDDSSVVGIQEVGGAIGKFGNAKYSGGISVDLVDSTYIGDIPSNDPSTMNCIDVGGMIGFVTYDANIIAGSGRFVITIDSTSMIYAGGTEPTATLSLEEAGTGGAFGRVGKIGAEYTKPNINTWNDRGNYDAYVEVLCESSNVAVYSATSNVGGVAGHILSGNFLRSFSTAVVEGDDYVGGFAGLVDSGYFVNCYSGGHTVGGQYVYGDENITGNNYVGGFLGCAPGPQYRLQQCYSTSSVRGASYVGGFAGYLGDTVSHSSGSYNCLGDYSTGLVSLVPGGDQDTIGAFAGCIENIEVLMENKATENNNGNKALRFVNDSSIRRIGTVGDELFVENDTYKYRIRWAYWGYHGASGDYIRVNASSNYSAIPFDPTLVPYDPDFPLRTFISYLNSSSVWFGQHVGDWPMPMNEDTKVFRPDNHEITFVDADYFDDDGAAYYYYRVGGVVPDIQISYLDSDGPHVLQENVDYQITIVNNDKSGVATAIISGKGDYAGSFVETFNILAIDISDATIDISGPAGGFVYNRVEQLPSSVTVTLTDGSVLPDSEYTIEYSDDRINAGDVTVTIVPNGDRYTSSEPLVATYKIQQAILNAGLAQIEVTGTVESPDVAVQYEGQDLPADAYSISCDHDIENGLLTVTITADGLNYTGEISVDVTVHEVVFVYGDTDSTVYVIDGQKVTIPTDYNVQVWYTDEAHTEEFDPDQEITDDIVLYSDSQEEQNDDPNSDPEQNSDNTNGQEQGQQSNDTPAGDEGGSDQQGQDNDQGSNTDQGT